MLGQNSLQVFIYQTIMITILIPYTYTYFSGPVIDMNNIPHTVLRLLIIVFSCVTIFIPAIINNRKKTVAKAKVSTTN